jgi:hypothetical protein
VDNTTEFDGSIEAAVGLIVQPEETVTEEVTDVTEDVTNVTEDVTEDFEESMDDSEQEESDDVAEDGDEEEVDVDEEGTDDAGQEQSRFKVKVDGEEVEVTLEDLKRGYSGQKYVQKGMQEAAAARKQAEEVYSALIAERQQIASLYQQIQSGSIAKPPSPPSKELFDRDPIGYMEEKIRYDEAKAQYDQQQAQFGQVVAQQSEAQKRAMQAYLQQEMENLKSVMPEFGDAEKATKIREKLVRGGAEYYGYSPEEIGQVMDHRAIRVLNDAVRYREIMAGKNKAEQKASGAKPVIKPGAKRPNSTKKVVQDKMKAQLRKSGRIEDALALIINQT